MVKTSVEMLKKSGLICCNCKKRMKKGETAIFYIHSGKAFQWSCTVCKVGKSELRTIEEENIDFEGIGQE